MCRSFRNASSDRMRQLIPIIIVSVMSGCGSVEDSLSSRILAEVGTSKLTYGEVRAAIPYAVWESDSLNATNDYVSRWALSKLLSKEAEKLGLHELKDVENRIRTQREDVLIETLRDRALQTLNDEITVSEAEVEAYFESNSNQFKLSERHVRIRHLSAQSLDFAVAAKRELQDGAPWTEVVQRYAFSKSEANASELTLRPLSTALSAVPVIQASLGSLPQGTISSIRESDGFFHFVQILESYPAGSIPDISWVKGRIFEWLTIEKRRKALLAFELNLMLKAQADGNVRIQTLP